MLQINNERKAIAAEIYWQIQDEIDQKLIINYIYNDGLIEDSKLTKWAAAKISLGKAVVIKRFKPKDITLAQNLSRAIQFVRRAASTSAYNISEADIKHIHAMISENLVDNPGEYRTNNIPDAAPKWFEIPREMRELVRLVNSRDYRKSIPVEQSAFTGYRFSQIHAFANHNEQVARLLMNYVLIKHHYPLTIIKAYDKQEYLDCLFKTNPIYFQQFIRRCVLNSVNSYRVMMGERLDLNLPSIKLAQKYNSYYTYRSPHDE